MAICSTSTKWIKFAMYLPLDTAFHFVIGGLLLVKIFQNRHPDIHTNSFITFFAIAVIIFCTSYGIVSDTVCYSKGITMHAILVFEVCYWLTLKLICAGFQSETPTDSSAVYVCYLSSAPGSVSGITLSPTQLEMG